MQIKIADIPEGFVWAVDDHDQLLAENITVVSIKTFNEYQEEVPLLTVYCDHPLRPNTKAFFQRIVKHCDLSGLDELEVSTKNGPEAGDWFEEAALGG